MRYNMYLIFKIDFDKQRLNSGRSLHLVFVPNALMQIVSVCSHQKLLCIFLEGELNKLDILIFTYPKADEKQTRFINSLFDRCTGSFKFMLRDRRIQGR